MPDWYFYFMIALSVSGLVVILIVLRRHDREGSPANLRLVPPALLAAVAAGAVGLIGLLS